MLGEKAGCDVTVAHGADWLRQDITARTNKEISVQTVKRLTGVLQYGEEDKIHLNSYNKAIIAHYLGFVNWKGLEQHLVEKTRGKSFREFQLRHREASCKTGEERFRLLKELADEGWIDTCFDVAECYLEGDGVEKNEARAIQILDILTQTGHVLSCAIMGAMYLEGYGDLVKQDIKQAKLHLEYAAEKGNADAQGLLAMLHHDSEYYSTALYYARLSARQNNGYGYAVMGRCFLEGEGVEPNVEEGMKFLRKAVEEGCEEAKDYLAEWEEKIKNKA